MRRSTTSAATDRLRPAHARSRKGLSAVLVTELICALLLVGSPQAAPADPVVAARQRYVEDRGGSSFYEYSVPQAIIGLKQGLGRLIRSTSDRGVLAVLDPRLRTKVYGQQFLKSLPSCRITSNIDDLYRVFEPEVSSFKFQVSGS